MRFRRLRLSGFKSFVEPADLAIEPGLTGVVGPNGCGKSNLLEAIRWVMGEASPKSLRGSGMDDVVFAGTATRAARDFAEVSLIVERAEGIAAELGESEVTRRIERGAGSSYRIDGRDVRAKDVSLLFADAATGAHSPALVSQGRIGAVIAAKPVERRLMLEEAAGIAGLHARRKDAEQKLRATEANLERLDEIMADQEARAAALRRQARAAERYRALTERIRLSEARLLFAHWNEADRAAGAAAEDATATGEQVQRLHDALRTAQALHEQSSNVVAERRAAALAAREAGTGLAHELATARAARAGAVRRLEELARLGATLAADAEREEALRADAERALQALEAERLALEERLAAGEATAGRIASDLSAAEAISREAEAKLAGLLAQEAAMLAERRVADAAVAAARSQLERNAQQCALVEGELAALGDGSEEQRAIAAAAKAGTAATAALAAAEHALAIAEAERTTASERRDEAEGKLAAARAGLAAAKAESAALASTMSRGDGALARLKAAPGLELALAAALGEDVDAPIGGDGARRWEGSEANGDRPLAAGLSPLLDHVEAPVELHRRLAQVGVADRDSGQTLAPGQRLVTRDGRMRRWDGFVSIGTGGAAAERLVRANRLAEIDRALPELELAAAQALGERDSAADAVEANRRAADDARLAATAAERTVRDSTRAQDAAAAARDRLAQQRSHHEERLADLQTLSASIALEVESAEQARAALPDPGGLERGIADARGEASRAGLAVAEARAASATRARESASDRERHAAAGREAIEWRSRAARAGERIAEAARRRRELGEERDRLSGEPDRLATEIARLEQRIAAGEASLSAALADERSAEEALGSAAKAMAELREAVAAAREARAGAVARAEAQAERRQEYARASGDRFECPPPLLPERLGFAADAPMDVDAEKDALDRAVAERERIGPVNLVAEKELGELDAGRVASAAERDELHQAIARLRGSIGSLNREGRVRLLDAYASVDAHFRSLFATLFDGGQAHLELIESEDPLEAGLEIMAQPPGKRLTALTLLSGGEQALTAVALIFALFLTNPAPICVLDEVDAPLDDANVDRFCGLLDRMSHETDTRYLIVTHNAVTMSRMHRLYGVTMIEQGVSRLVSVDLGAAEQLIAAE